MKYITLTLNPTLDIDYILPRGLEKNTLNRAPEPPRKRFSGKGINISRALRSMGADADTIYLARGADAESMMAALTAEGLRLAPIPAGGGARTNVSILAGDEATEINDPGSAVAGEEIDAAVERVKSLIDENGSDSVIFLSGSIPPGCRSDVYADIIRYAGKRKAVTVLDCDGETMRRAVAACPRLVKPNRRELFEYAALSMECQSLAPYKKALFTVDSEENHRAAAAELCVKIRQELGCDILCTLDSEGSVYVTDTVTAAPARRAEIKSFKGAGDSFIAAFMFGLKVTSRILCTFL